MSKITLTDLVNLENETTAVNAINANSAVIQTAFDNTLSRDGTAPNQMQATLDMNSNHIINLPTPASANEPLRLADAYILNGGGTIPINNLPVGGTAGQVLTKNSTTNFDASWLNIPPFTVMQGTVAVSGASTTYTSAQNSVLVERSNSGAAMADTLPGTSSGVLPANTIIIVTNNDPTALMSIGVGSGASFKTSIASTGYVYLGPGQTATFYTDGVNYWQLSGPALCSLTANTTIYASVSGSGNGNGLTSANSIAGIQAMWNFATTNLDLAGFNLTMQCADGTYSTVLGLQLQGGFVGQTNVYDTSGVFSTSANVILQGNLTTPDNAIITCTGSNQQGIFVGPGAALIVKGFKITGGASGAYCVFVWGGFIQLTQVDFGACGEGQVSVNNPGVAFLSPPYSISGSANSHAIAGSQGAFVVFLTISGGVTITGTPNFTSGFVVAQSGNVNALTNVTFTGSASGPHYSAFLNGVITSVGGSPTFYPGSTSGLTSTGGQYQ